jgi:hypothetical protein
VFGCDLVVEYGVLDGAIFVIGRAGIVVIVIVGGIAVVVGVVGGTI